MPWPLPRPNKSFFLLIWLQIHPCSLEAKKAQAIQQYSTFRNPHGSSSRCSASGLHQFVCITILSFDQKKQHPYTPNSTRDVSKWEMFFPWNNPETRHADICISGLSSTIFLGGTQDSGTPVFLGGLDVLSEPSGWYQTFQVPFKAFHFQQAWCSEGKVTERRHLEPVDSLGFSANGRVSFLGCWNMSCDWWGCCNYHHVGFDIGVYVYTVYIYIYCTCNVYESMRLLILDNQTRLYVQIHTYWLRKEKSSTDAPTFTRCQFSLHHWIIMVLSKWVICL